MKTIYVLLGLLLIVVLSGCGASFRKPLTSENMSAHKNVTSVVKERYTDVVNTMGFHGWNDVEKDNIIVSTFYIPTNKTSKNADTNAFMKDMLSICNYKNGTFKDLEATSKENNKKHKELIAKYTTYTEEENDTFECGPEGKGTRSTDWTKFNSEVCRKLPPKRIAHTDKSKVSQEYGYPPQFGCYKDNGAVFIGKLSDDDDNRKSVSGSTLGSEAVKINIRLNEGKSGLINPSQETQSINIL